MSDEYPSLPLPELYTTAIAMHNTVTGEVIVLTRGTTEGKIELNRLQKMRHPQIWTKPLWEQLYAPTRNLQRPPPT